MKVTTPQMRGEEFFRAAQQRKTLPVYRMPVGAFAGLGSMQGSSGAPAHLAGYWSTMGCSAHEIALDAIKEALRRAEVAGLQNADAYIRAKSYFDNNPIVYPWACEEHTASAGQILQALNTVLGSRAEPTPDAVLAQMRDAGDKTKPPEEMPLWQKAIIFGGLGIAGLVTVAVILGQVSPLLRLIPGKK